MRRMIEMKERQVEIIRAAGEILTDSGVSGLTTKSLAAKMGFGESALYRHFKGKEDIVLTMLRYLAEDMDSRLVQAVAGLKSPEEKLKTIFNNQFDFFKKNPHFLVAIFSEGLLEESKSINEAIREIMATKRKHLLKVIEEGQDLKKFTDRIAADDLVHIIMGSFRLHMLQWRLSGFAFDLKAKGNRLMEKVLSLIRE